MDDARIYFFSALTAIWVTVAFFAGLHCGADYIRNEAIEAGAAHYEADPVSGETRLVWTKGKP